MDTKRLASLISIMLGPQTWLPMLFLIVMFKSGLSREQLVILFPSILFLQVIVPLIYLYSAPKLGLATEWDLPKRKERYPFLLLVFATSLISLFLIQKFGNKLLLDLNLLLISTLLIAFIITFYWQISLHTALNTLGAISVNLLLGWNLIILFLTIPVVFWARSTLTKHTPTQLIAGVILPAFILLGSLYYLGYL